MATRKPTITAFLCAKDEEAQLRDAVETALWCDEVLVWVPKSSSDNTLKIAQQLAKKHKNVRAVEHNFPWEVKCRNEGIAASKGEWVLMLDADERVSQALAQEIRDVITHGKADYYRIPFDNYVGNRLVRYGWGAHFGVTSTAKLFRKGARVFKQGEVHPSSTFIGTEGPRLQHRMVHYMLKDMSHMFQLLNYYSSMHARSLALQNDPKETLGRNIRRVFSRFLKCYVQKKGYKEGLYGFAVAMCAGLYPLFSYLKWQCDSGTESSLKRR